MAVTNQQKERSGSKCSTTSRLTKETTGKNQYSLKSGGPCKELLATLEQEHSDIMPPIHVQRLPNTTQTTNNNNMLRETEAPNG